MRLNRQRRHEHHPPPAPTPTPPQNPSLRLVANDPALTAERRMRSAGGPQDQAMYRCQCGFVFEAPVTTTVQCPHCDHGIAW